MPGECECHINIVIQVQECNKPLLSDAVLVPSDTLSVCLLDRPDSSSIDSIASAEAIAFVC